MADDRRTGSASVFRLDPDGSEALVLEGATISNGLAWSPGGGIAYWNDTPTQCVAVLAHDADSGSLTRQGVFTEIPEGLGAPDGLTLDDQGGVWVALNGGAAVHRYAPDGRLDVVVRVGAEQVTACTFAGEDLRDLVITTSREDLPAGVDPAAGSLFHCRPGHRGLPTATFAG